MVGWRWWTLRTEERPNKKKNARRNSTKQPRKYKKQKICKTREIEDIVQNYKKKIRNFKTISCQNKHDQLVQSKEKVTER